MSDIGQPQSAPQVQTTFNDISAGAQAEPARRNSALELAGSLADVSSAAHEFATEYGQQAQQQARAHAQKVALDNQGKTFAELVRTGKIEPTQSPWFMQAYNEASSKIRAGGLYDQLNAQAATWPERNDPTAFQKRYAVESDKIGQQFANDPDSQAGYVSAAGPAQQQAYAANAEINVQRIQAENKQNISSEVSQAVLTLNQQTGGHPSQAQLNTALAPLEAKWKGVGLANSDWNVALREGIIGASESSQRPGILDETKKLSNGVGGSIYDEEGNAEVIETARHRIMSNNMEVQRTAMAQAQFHDYQQDRQAQGTLVSMFGPKVYTQGLTSDEATQAAQQLSAKGYDAASIASAFGSLAKSSNDIRELQANHYIAYGNSIPGSQHIASMYHEAQTVGWSPNLQDDLGDAVLRGDISQETASHISDMATKRSAIPVGGVNPASTKATNINAWSTLRNTISSQVTTVTAAVKRSHAITLTPTDQDALQDTAVRAAGDYLITHKRDFPGAQAQAKQAVIDWWTAYEKQNSVQGTQPVKGQP